MPYYDQIPTVTTLEMALELMTVEQLKQLVGVVKADRRGSKKADQIAAIIGSVEGEGLRTLWSRLDAVQQAAVSEVVHAESPLLDLHKFHAKYGDVPNMGEFSRWGGVSNPSVLGAFFFNGIMPADLKHRLKSIVPEPSPVSLITLEGPPALIRRQYQVYDYETRKSSLETEEVPVVLEEREQAAQADLHSLLRAISAGKLSVSDKTLMPTTGTIKVIESILQGGDYYPTQPQEDLGEEEIGPIKPIAWALLIYAANLASLAGKRLALTPIGQKAIPGPPAQTIKMVWERWIDNTQFDELRRINAVKGQTGKGQHALTSARSRRHAIVATLKECPGGKWISVDNFWRYLIASGHDFEVTRDLWSLYVADANYGLLGQADYVWTLLQGRYILALLFEYAATLGLLDVAYTPPMDARSDYSELWGTDDFDFFSRYDGLVAFRVNALGAYCLDLAPDYTPAPTATRAVLRTLPNRDVVVTAPPIAPGDALLLDLFAVKTSDLVWHLDNGKTLTALEDGHSLGDLRKLLQERSEADLPDTIVRFLDEMEERGGKLKDVGLARLIECSDPHVVTLLAHDPRTRALCIQAGERHLVVPEPSEKAFRKALRQLGYILPR
jgi:hypothetical protein